MNKIIILLFTLILQACSERTENTEMVEYTLKTIHKKGINTTSKVSNRINDDYIDKTLYPTKHTKRKLLTYIKNNNISKLETMLKKLNNINFIYKDKDANTPFFYAIKSNNMKIIKLFISSGASIHYKNINQLTPLHYAVLYSSKEVVEYLIQEGANLNAKDSFGRTPLHYSSIERKPLIRAVLISNSAKVTTDIYGNTFNKY